MLFRLLFELRLVFGPFRVFRYTSFRIIAATVTAMLISFFLYPWFIRQLKRIGVGQVIRQEMDESHQKKRDTPTMGGSLMLFAIVVPTLLWADLANGYVWLALGVTTGYAAIGLVDDIKKVRSHDSRGLPGKYKLLFQFAIAIGAMALLLGLTDYGTILYFPFVKPDAFHLDLPFWVYVAFASVAIVGMSNAVNLTDGLDGLAIGPSIVASGTFLILAYAAATALGIRVTAPDGEIQTYFFDLADYLGLAKVQGVQELAIFAGAIMGAGVGFLWFNTFPAQIFMGDVGSLSIGGAIGVLAVATKNELLSLIICGIFVLEAVSVILQRYYYKATRRRIFLMAPIHHHFEKKQWSESQVVVRFWIIAILLSLFALASLKLR
ncbi:MAG: phospho-N-acetylmuramoyl-pentapeptide-transferase [Bradymonadales bacterium]|nr:phospho-N-acetylmuramoyl-pentapeptide-transferase [Bradymonadales bacterium]